MKPPRGLSEAEKALWARVTLTVTPLAERRRPASSAKPPASLPPSPSPQGSPEGKVGPPPSSPPPRLHRPAPGPVPAPPQLDKSGLDSHWERRLCSAAIAPEFTLDLHGHNLDQAHRRLESGLAQAKAMGARLVLVIAGRQRRSDPADRATSRGAIRAKILDWLAAGPHSDDIAAVRPAQRRHGGDGAVYLVLRKRR